MIVAVMMFASFGTAHAEAVPLPGRPVIGIAWRADTDSEFFTNICKAVEAAGASWVMLDQVQSADLDYDTDGRLTQGVTALGSLDEAAAKRVRVNTWHDSTQGVTVLGSLDKAAAKRVRVNTWHDSNAGSAVGCRCCPSCRVQK